MTDPVTSSSEGGQHGSRNDNPRRPETQGPQALECGSSLQQQTTPTAESGKGSGVRGGQDPRSGPNQQQITGSAESGGTFDVQELQASLAKLPQRQVSRSALDGEPTKSGGGAQCSAANASGGQLCHPEQGDRGRNWFTRQMPPYEPSTRKVKAHLIPGSRPLTAREPGPSLTDRRNSGPILGVCIVTYFMIRPKGQVSSTESRGAFLDKLSRMHNEKVPVHYPRMSREIEKTFPSDTRKWNMHEDRFVLSTIRNQGRSVLSTIPNLRKPLSDREASKSAD